MMKILVTGGGGFLGSHVVERLLERGDDVTIVARSAYPEMEALGAKSVRADICNAPAVADAVRGMDAVIHTAAMVGMSGAREDFWRVNVMGTQNLLDASRDAGVSRFVFTSSPSVTFSGEDEVGVGQDAAYPERYLASYPETKAEAERRALAAHDPEGMRVTSLRPHLIWGPGDPHLIPRLVERAKRGKLKIVGDGANVVDITYIDNAAKAHVQALDALARADSEPNPGGKPYFISNDEPVELWPWINGLLGRLGVAPVTRRVSLSMAERVGGVLERGFKLLPTEKEPPMTRFIARQLATSHWYDMGPAKRDFGYAPEVSMDEGLERLVASMT
ncbi:MAG: NAD-dependent epimerase/dehydratase family protein [Myxococcota bacterium]